MASQAPATRPNADKADLLDLHGRLLTIRLAEERLGRLFADGEVPGFIHLSLGQEAVPVGVCRDLAPSDAIASNHRGHGHALAKGMDLDRFFLEILGKEDGLCRGRGGSMHVADFSVGMLGANGIVGAGLSLALGGALAHQVSKTNGVAVAFFGDGALAEGLLHECLNLGAVWKLPLLFVCENNGWSEFTRSADTVAPQPTALAAAYGIATETVDGNDVLAVREAAGRLLALARAGKGPGFLECRTTRWRGHFEGDPQKYRAEADLSAATANDPVSRHEARLVEMGVTAAEIAGLRETVAARVEKAVAKARAGALPDFARALGDVYTKAGA
ncbi:MAG: thiamine pyrophosphate-dependent dehydrogenase E1 component subunit alpha [Alphaproteobacteria bacterium]|nr:thiamine pyrophosphate-dependent dehydrogenase E1 component subunit alpha [Alphaproteobacteria bacterium]